MARQTINTGATANDGTGDGLRTAFGKVNNNFTELYAQNIKEWINPNTGNTWSIIQISGGVTVNTAIPEIDDVNTEVLITFSGNSFYIPRDETTQRIQDYWDNNVPNGYDYTRVFINSVEYEGFVTTYNQTGWVIQLDTGPAEANSGDPVVIRYVGNQPPTKWFDANTYPNSENFLGAKIDYYALVEGKGQQIGTIWFTGTHDQYGYYESAYNNSDSGGATSLTMDSRPDQELPSTSLWLTTESPTPETVSIIWDAKVFYGSGGIVTPEIIPD